MPAIFLYGNREFVFSGLEKNVSRISDDIGSGWAGVTVAYKGASGVNCEFDFKLKDVVSGDFSIEKIDHTSMRVVIDGVIKTSVQKDVIDDLVTGGLPWRIDGVTNGDCVVKTPVSDAGEGLLLGKKAPKP